MTDPSPRAVARLQAGARAAALFAAAVGIVVLAGWLFDVRLLMQVLPGQVAMVPDAALGFILAGLALWWQAGVRTRSSLYASRAAAALAGLLGLMSLFEYVSDKNLGIDELLFRDPRGLTGVFPGRMSVITALSFTVLAVALLTSGLRRAPWTSDALAFVPGLFAAISLASYVYGVSGLYWIGIYKGMAIHAALAFLVLTVGALLARGDGGFSGLILSDTAGGAIARRILPVVLGVPLLLGWVGLFGERARLYGSEFEEALIAVANATMLLAALCVAAERLRRTDEETRRSQDALKVSERRYEELVAFAPIGIIRTMPDGRFVSANAAFARMLGYESPEEILSLDTRRDLYLDPLDRERLVREIEVRGEPAGVEVRMKRRDGSPVWVRSATRAVRDAFGAAKFLESFVYDVTDRKRAEETRARLAAVVESSEDAIVSKTLEGIITSWNAGAEKLYGFSPQEAMGRPIGFHVPSDKADEIANILARIRRGQSVDQLETVRLRKDGTAIDVSLTVSPIRDEFGEITGASSIARDITGRKRAEEAIHKLLRAVEQAENVIFMTDPQGTITYVNPAFERIYGYSGEEALGKTPRILKSGRQDRAYYERFWQRLLAGESVREEFVNRRRDGQLVTVEAHVSPVLDAQKRWIGFIAVQHDVSQRRLLEEQLRHVQKMEAVGQLAGGVAHDFNNLLTVLLGYADLLAGKLDPQSQEFEELEQIRKAGERAASLTSQLLAFSRQQVFERKILNVNRLIGDLEKMLHRLIGEDMDLVTVLDPALAPVSADAGQLEQVLLNLAVNARHAMPRGGKLTIETSNVELDEAYARLHASVRPGRYVMIAVSDTGVGMDAETISRIFEPFFTTKERGKGTGLGLATVYGIVKQSGGHIGVYSEPGKGATFKVYLPPAEEDLRAEEATAGEAASPRGTETVLLVEDEVSVRTLTRTILESFGYEVLEAAGADEALEIAGRGERPIHLLLTDVIMPVMSGPDLARRIEALLPGIKMLYMSGYTDDTVFRHGHVKRGGLFLQKPFTPEALARKLRKALKG